MPNSYTQLVDLKNRVERDLAQLQNNVTAAVAAFASAEASLASMGTTYSGWATEVNALSTANPSNTAATVLKAQKDAILAEFGTLTTKVVALKNAVAEV